MKSRPCEDLPYIFLVGYGYLDLKKLKFFSEAGLAEYVPFFFFGFCSISLQIKRLGKLTLS